MGKLLINGIWICGIVAAGGCDPEPLVSATPRHAPTNGAATLPERDLKILVFSRTEGFRHGSIAQAVPAIEEIGAQRGWQVDATEDAGEFELNNLLNYDVVVFALTTGDVLNNGQQDAFEDYIGMGRGYVGVHSATDTEFDWAWYGEMLGGYFDGHPAPQEATIEVIDGTHPSTAHLGAQWVRNDEWYNFDPNPSATVNVLLRLDEDSYNGGKMGDDHPIAWTHEFGGGRAFYTGGGHRPQNYSEPDFLTHLAGGIEWAAGDPVDGGTSTGTSTGGGSTAGADGDTSVTTASSGAEGTPTDGPEPESDGGSNPSATTGGASATAANDETSSPSPSSAGQGSAPGENESDEGCGCRSSASDPGALGLFVLILVGAGRPRFRRHRWV